MLLNFEVKPSYRPLKSRIQFICKAELVSWSLALCRATDCSCKCIATGIIGDTIACEALEMVLNYPVSLSTISIFLVPMKDKFKLQGHLIENRQQ